MDTRAWVLRVKEYMKTHHMAETGDGILAAVSGGADSVCLLLVLQELSAELGIHLAAFHLNHGLRGAEADRDEAYVRELCRELNVPLKVIREDVAGFAAENGLSEEEAGRVLRYRHLAVAAEEYSCQKIATAHHKDDHVETVLMNLFRGSGLKGMGGIRPVRDKIIRPLLGFERKEIEEYLNRKKVGWCEDSTNKELQYGRNKVRNVLVPWVKEHVNDQAAAHIVKTAEFAAQADEYFAFAAEKLLCEWADSGHEGEKQEELPQQVKIPTRLFDAQPEIMKTYLVRAMISRACGSGKDISAKHIEAICGLSGPGGGTEVSLPYGLQAVRGYETLEIRRFSPDPTPKKCKISMETRTFPWKKDLEIPKNQCTKWFDYDKIKGVLCVRTRETGDYYMIGGEKRKMLKRFFIDEKIPEEIRDEMPLLAEGNHILWIIGYRISEYYKVSESTRTVLEIHVNKGEENGV